MIKRTISFCILLFPAIGFTQNLATYGSAGIPLGTYSSASQGATISSQAIDANLSFDNPALIDSLNTRQVAFNYLNYVSDINQVSLSAVSDTHKLGIFGGYLRYMDFGSFVETDESGREIGNFRAGDYEVGVSLSRQYTERIKYGVTLKQLASNYYAQFSYAIGVDLGAYYESKDGYTSLGFVVNNLGRELKQHIGSGGNWLIPEINFGLSRRLKKAPFRLTLQYNDLQQWNLIDGDASAALRTDPISGETEVQVFSLDNLSRHFRFSAEFLPSDKFSLVLGYDLRRRAELALEERPGMVGFSFGAFIKMKRFEIHYALANYHRSAATNQFGIVTNINDWGNRRTVVE